ncbi:MAG: hypothetical protein PHO08_14685 [Methylococcales bacterium]|nr:hypothetical protein [Methylococcales bacterium]MDD5631493.1 hypothetical protein [Methylococcales bacterium]
MQKYDFEELTFEYAPEELGIKAEDAAKIGRIHQLRPLYSGQPWGIFFVEFENKKIPVVVLRRILSHLVVKKRTSANKSSAAAWDSQDLLFISAFGDTANEEREIAFAHFHQEPGDLPTLRVLGWDGADTPLKLAHLDKVLHEKLRWPDKPSDQQAWRKQWRAPFRHRIGHIIRTSDALAEVLAQLARNIRDRAQTMLAAEADNGPLRTLHIAFRTSLIHDLSEVSFADTYAQTITYGLLTAAISRTDRSEGRHGTALITENITDMVPTNPFLKEMLQTFLRVGGRKGGIDFDELGIQDVVELLRGEETDLPAILCDFGNRTRGEDPVIHFYEHFLSAYNKKLKVQRGVFYTPQPVVSYIVRSVHELLQTEFGLEDGLASTITWGEMAQINLPLSVGEGRGEGEFKIPEGTDLDSPFVVILDPATGTATFLVEVIDIIYRTLTEKWRKLVMNDQQRETAWNVYVPQHLLPRLYGYELMMAPYAIAHMKIGLKLHETGYRFGSEERARIYLTNALEPASDDKKQMEFEEVIPALAHEAKAVNAVKQKQRFTVVIGNPPYSGHSVNNGDWIVGLLRKRIARSPGYFEVDGAPLGERNPKWLNDDYVKFIRLAQVTIEQAQTGLLGYITNHGYLDNPTFRGMRQSLLCTFDKSYLLDLHGNSKRKEKAEDGSKDENVFDIQQGVAIGVFVKEPISPTPSAKVTMLYSPIPTAEGAKTRGISHAGLYGLRTRKYQRLTAKGIQSTDWKKLHPKTPFYLFSPQNESLRDEYENGWNITEAMRINVLGFQTHRDDFAIDLDESALRHRIVNLRSEEFTDEELLEKYNLQENQNWKLGKARKLLRQIITWEKHFIKCLYRPFDVRWCYLDTVAMDRPRPELQEHVAGKDNCCLLLIRQMQDTIPYSHVLTSRYIAQDRSFTCSRGAATVFPLYVYPKTNKTDLFDDEPTEAPCGRRPNLDTAFISAFASALNLAFTPEGKGDLNTYFGPEDVFGYVYAVFHSPTYRTRYAEFLRIDFPRLPITRSLELFRELSKLGGELVSLHLLESPKINQFITQFTGEGDNSIPKKPTYKEGAVWINASQRFENVPEAVWNFHVGGYQVCEKWLKDRKGRRLNEDDIAHYQKIVVALNETIRLMREIDAVIALHGGWPGAFQPAAN